MSSTSAVPSQADCGSVSGLYVCFVPELLLCTDISRRKHYTRIYVIFISGIAAQFRRKIPMQIPSTSLAICAFACQVPIYVISQPLCMSSIAAQFRRKISNVDAKHEFGDMQVRLSDADLFNSTAPLHYFSFCVAIVRD